MAAPFLKNALNICDAALRLSLVVHGGSDPREVQAVARRLRRVVASLQTELDAQARPRPPHGDG